MTNEQIVDLYEGLAAISEDKDLKFKALISFQLTKNKNLLKPFYESISEARQKLIEKYGEPQEDGWLIPNNKLPQFKAEFEALMFTETYVATEEILVTDLEEERLGIELMERLLPIIKK